LRHLSTNAEVRVKIGKTYNN